MGLRMRVHDREPIGLALRRFKKLIERSGMQKELRSRQHYEKPCEVRRRALLRKQRTARRGFSPKLAGSHHWGHRGRWQSDDRGHNRGSRPYAALWCLAGIQGQHRIYATRMPAELQVLRCSRQGRKAERGRDDQSNLARMAAPQMAASSG